MRNSVFAVNRFQAWYRAQPRALRVLLTINVAVYVLWVFVLAHFGVTNAFVRNHLALNPDLPGLLFEPWQLITYNFLHIGGGLGGFLHVLFNMLWLVWIGREYEEMHGAHQLLGVYLLAGLGGGLLTVLLHALFPGAAVFAGSVHGASASVIGIAMAVAITYPYKKIGLLLIGPIRLIYLVAAFLVLDVVFLLSGSSGTAVGAHLGGALFGFFIAKGEERGMDLTGWARLFFHDRRSQPAATRSSGGVLDRMEAWLGRRLGREETAGDDEERSSTRTARRTSTAPTQDETEVDRILEKISAQGMESLTEEERRILYEASRR